MKQRASICESLGVGSVSSRVELDDGVETRWVERSVGTQLQQVERSKRGEDMMELLLKPQTADQCQTNTLHQQEWI